MRKHKIIDTIFLYDEIEMLYFRLTELDEYVDEFIIMECEMDFKGNSKPLNYLQNIDMFKKWEDKITYIPTPQIDIIDLKLLYDVIEFSKKFEKNNDVIGKNDLRFFQITTLIGSLLNKSLDYDDLILISDVDEIPDLSKSDLFKSHLKFGPILFRQTNFIWSTKYYNIIPNMGTLGIQFSRLMTNPDMIYLAYFNKSISSNKHFEIIDNGFHFSHFYSLEKTIKKIELLHDDNFDYTLTELNDKITYCYENLISIKRNFEDMDYSLTEYDGVLPKNIHLLKNQLIGRDWTKKTLILLNSDDSFNMEESFDTILKINITEDTNLPFNKKLTEKIISYNILKPLKIYYKTDDVIDLESFQKVFYINHIKKIIRELLPIDQDLIVFMNGENPTKTVTYPWKEVKNKFIYDLIKDIL
jgi:hypothetical protein